jgi:YkoP-like protein
MLRTLVTMIDEKLRASHDIREYSTSPDCIFRMEIVSSAESAVLMDGTVIRAGDRIINLHLWNEHIPTFPRAGPTLGWALRLHRAFQTSLTELDRFLAGQPELRDIIAIRGDMSFGSTERSDQLLAMAARYGFERIKSSELSLPKRVHRFGENVLISMLVLLCNPAAFHSNSLWRTRTPVVLSRKTLHRQSGMGKREALASDPRGRPVHSRIEIR